MADGRHALRDLFNATFAVDWSKFSLSASAVPALGILITIVGGAFIGNATAAATASAGALLAGVASRTGGTVKPIGTMIAIAMSMSVTAFIGSVTGRMLWLHLLVVLPIAFLAGLLVIYGTSGSVLGTQSLVGMLIFGRYPESLVGAAHIGAYVLMGGFIQVILAMGIRWPRRSSLQRQALHVVYGALAALAAEGVGGSVNAGAALDEVERQFTGYLSGGSGDLMANFRSLIDLGRRIRLELLVLVGLRSRLVDLGEPAELLAEFDAIMMTVSRALQSISTAPREVRTPLTFDALESEVALFVRDTRSECGDGNANSLGTVTSVIADHLESLSGQLRAAAWITLEGEPARMATTVSANGVLLARFASPTFKAQVEILEANLTFTSESFRHAMRLAVTVVVATLLASDTFFGRGYWIAVTAVVVLRPDFGSTLARGLGRVVGTAVGVVVASLVVAIADPSHWVLTVLIFLFGWAALAVFMSFYSLFAALLSALVVLLVSLVTPSTYTVALDRLIDTAVGGTLALLVYVVWPTWSRTAAHQALHEVLVSIQRYTAVVLGGIVEGETPRDEVLLPVARRVRLGISNAQAIVVRSLSEPTGRRIAREFATGGLAAMRRVNLAVLALRTEVEAGRIPHGLPELRRLLEALLLEMDLLIAASDAMGVDGSTVPRPLPPLRSLYGEARDALSPDPSASIVLVETDEILDALDTYGMVLGLSVAEGNSP